MSLDLLWVLSEELLLHRCLFKDCHVSWLSSPGDCTVRYPWGQCHVRPWPLIGMSELAGQCLLLNCSQRYQTTPIWATSSPCNASIWHHQATPLCKMPQRYKPCARWAGAAKLERQRIVLLLHLPCVWTARAQRWISVEVGAVLLLRWAQSPGRTFLEQYCKFKLRW